MSLGTLEVGTTTTGLDHLVSMIEQGGVKACWQVTENCLAAALEQLEFDDRFDGAITDAMVDTLMSAEEALAEGQSVAGALNRLVALYNRARREGGLEGAWRSRAANLPEVELETELWLDLYEIVDLVMDGDLDTVQSWLEETTLRFRRVWDHYESNTVVFDEEITSETVLCHRFLKEGALLWLEALLKLQSGEVDEEEIFDTAEQGQRLLVMVQIIESELASAEEKYFVNFN